MNDQADRAKAIADQAHQLACDAVSIKVRTSLKGMLRQLLPEGIDHKTVAAVHGGLIGASLTDLWNRAGTHPAQRAASLREMFWRVASDVISQLEAAEIQHRKTAGDRGQ